MTAGPVNTLDFAAVEMIAGYLAASGIEQVIRTMDYATAPLPSERVEVTSEQPENEFPDAAITDQAFVNLIVPVAVRIVTNIDNTQSGGVVTTTARERHRRRIGEVSDLLLRDDIIALLNAQESPAVCGTIQNWRPIPTAVDNSKYVGGLQIDMHMRGKP